MPNEHSELLNEIIRFQKISGEPINEGIMDNILTYLGDAAKNISKTDFSALLKKYFPNINLKDKEQPKETIPSLNTTDDTFYEDILKCLGAPKTESNMKFFYAWRQSEGAKAKFNPFNTTKNMPGSTFYNCLKKDSSGNCVSGVRNYATREDGIKATCNTIKNSRYSNILAQLRSGNVPASEIAANTSELRTWGTGDLIAKVIDSYDRGATPKPPPIAMA